MLRFTRYLIAITKKIGIYIIRELSLKSHRIKTAEISFKGNTPLDRESRQNNVDRFKKSEGDKFSREAERIFKFYVLFGPKSLSAVAVFASTLRERRITGLNNNEVDRLLNDIFDDKNGLHAYKIGLVKETVDGVEIDHTQNNILRQFLLFLQETDAHE